MKKLVFILALTISTFSLAQQTYTVNNETLELKTEVEGTLDLLWNIIDNQYRYFVKLEDNSIKELTNSKNSDNKYNNAYQKTLNDLTGEDASKTKLTLYSLKQFINKFNAVTDTNYTFDDSKPKLKLRLGGFVGLTNNPFITNPNNEKVPFFGVELELFQDTEKPKHAGFLNIRTAGDKANFQYASTQVALGYRFRFVNQECFNIYAQTKFATLISSKTTVGTIENTSIGFDIPFIFGLGADFKVGKGYITLVADSLYNVFGDSTDNFPIDLALGYKFNL